MTEIPNLALQEAAGRPIEELVPGISPEQSHLLRQCDEGIPREAGRLVFELGVGGRYCGADGQLLVSEETWQAFRGDEGYRELHGRWLHHPYDRNRYQDLQTYTLIFLARIASFEFIAPPAPAKMAKKVGTVGSGLGI